MKYFKAIMSLVIVAAIFSEFVLVSLPFMDTLDKSSVRGLATGIAILLAHIASASAVLYGIAEDFFEE